MANMTPMDIANHRQDHTIIRLLSEYHQNRKSEREREASERAELIENKQGKLFAETMTKVAGKSESELRLMMSRGEVVTNMWSSIRDQLIDEQQLVLGLQQEYNMSSEQLASTREQIVALQKKEKELMQQVEELQHRLKRSEVLQQSSKIVETLSRAEVSGEKQLKKQLKEAQQAEDTLITLEDVGFFLNSLGMARNARKLFALSKDAPDMIDISIADAAVLLTDDLPLSDRLDIQFGIDMVKHNQYPSYQKHWRNCAVCRSSVTELLAEYQINFKEEVEQFSSFGIPYLHISDLPSIMEVNSRIEKVKIVKTIKIMLENHRNTFSVVEQS